jgi:hypothetical protein
MLKIANEYGNYDLTKSPIPRGYTHVKGQRLSATCNKLKLKFVPAVVGFEGDSRYGYRPIKNGVIVTATSAPKLLTALAERVAKAAKRNTQQLQRIAANPFAILEAMFTLNRRAKRCRDLSQEFYQQGMHGICKSHKKEKERIYRLKGQALAHLLAEQKLAVVGVHQLGESGNYAEVLRGEEFTFHRTCPAPIQVIESTIEAKPKGAKELTLSLAYKMVEDYLAGKPTVEVYQWPPTYRPRRRFYDDDKFDDENEDEWET